MNGRFVKCANCGCVYIQEGTLVYCSGCRKRMQVACPPMLRYAEEMETACSSCCRKSSKSEPYSQCPYYTDWMDGVRQCHGIMEPPDAPQPKVFRKCGAAYDDWDKY